MESLAASCSSDVGSFVKAVSAGAKTVKGPAPWSAVTRLALVSAATRLDSDGVATAAATTSATGSTPVGSSTRSITCATPLYAAASATVTVATVGEAWLSRKVTVGVIWPTVTCWPLSVVICCAAASEREKVAPAATW